MKITLHSESPSVPDQLTIERRVLHEEVGHCLRNWLRDQVPGTRLLPDRQLARQLEVSRPTLRKALDALLRSGELERIGRKTCVARKEFGAELPDSHPFIHSTIYPAQPVASIRMAVFENLPNQRRCWSRLSDAFNASHKDVQLAVQYLPSDIVDGAKYADYIRQYEPDLVLLPSSMLQKLREARVLKPVPDAIVRELDSDAFLKPALEEPPDETESGTYAVPLHCGFQLVAWNTDLMGAEFNPTNDAVDARTAAQWFLQAADHLPAGRCVAANPEDLIAAMACDRETWSAADTHACIGEAVDIGIEMMAIGQDRLMCRESDRRLGMRAFGEGRAAFVTGPSYLLLDALRSATAPWRCAVLMPREPYKAWVGATMVGITANGNRGADAVEAVRFLVSSEAQSIIAEGGLNCPVRRQCVGPLADFLKLPTGMFMRAVDRLRFGDRRRTIIWAWFVHDVMTSRIRELLAGPERPSREETIAYLEAYVSQMGGLEI